MEATHWVFTTPEDKGLDQGEKKKDVDEEVSKNAKENEIMMGSEEEQIEQTLSTIPSDEDCIIAKLLKPESYAKKERKANVKEKRLNHFFLTWQLKKKKGNRG